MEAFGEGETDRKGKEGEGKTGNHLRKREKKKGRKKEAQRGHKAKKRPWGEEVMTGRAKRTNVRRGTMNERSEKKE